MTAFITVLGFVGAACFALCTAPQILRVLKRKSTADISLLFILLSLGGNLCSATYIFYTNWCYGYWQIPQYFNYTIATTLVVTLLCLKIKYDKEQIKESFRRSVSELQRKYYKWQYELYQNREKVWTAGLLGIMFVGTILYLCLT
jgi:uncharacterized protein with PQ loop repeat